MSPYDPPLRRSRSRRRRGRLPLLLALLLPGGLLGQEAPESTAELLQDGWHVVRPGETLEGITALYFGDSSRWPENWRLNPEIEDPDLIVPGQRIRVLLPGQLPPQTAQMIRKSRRVDDQLQPHPWAEAVEKDLLYDGDGVRTFQTASAELYFPDATSLVLTEESLVFLGVEQTGQPAVARHLIEIVQGQADLARDPLPGAAREIEVVLGGATAYPRPSDTGDLQTRARRPGAGGAQLMVYRGMSDFAAAGTRVTVPEGSGSKVEEGSPPSPPEELLPAPAGLQPAAGSRVVGANPELSWQPVGGARSYTVEVCREPSCGRLVARARPLTGVAWRASGLPLGRLYWRVTAVSTNDLDGYPSAPTPFTILAQAADTSPPRAVIRFVGPQYRTGGQLVVGPGIELVLATEAGGSGLRRWQPIRDGAELEGEGWGDSWSTGGHTVSALLVDLAGNTTRIEPVSFLYDDVPPRLRWGAEGGEEIGSVSAGEGISGPAPAGMIVEVDQVLWSSNGERWIPMGRRQWSYDVDRPFFSYYDRGSSRRKRGKRRDHLVQGRAELRERRLPFPQPRFVLRSTEKGLRIGDIEAELTPKRGLWMEAVEEICRVEEMRFQLRTIGEDSDTNRSSGGESLQLTVEAVDSVGNWTRMQWPLPVPSREE